MKTYIALCSDFEPLPSWPAIVRGQVALHLTPIHRGTAHARQGDHLIWTVTHIPTGYAVFCVIGAWAGRQALRALSGVDFSAPKRRLLQQLNAVIADLDQRGVRFPYRTAPPKAKKINPAVLELLRGGEDQG